jgi:DNA-binding NtrC family response regulator
MTSQVLVIEPQPSPLQASLDLALILESGVSCARVNWDSNVIERLSQSNARLIIAVAVPPVTEVTELFLWLQDHPIPTPPILAILPEAAEKVNLQPVFEVADDFMLAPVRGEELRARIERLLANQSDELEAAHARVTKALGLGQLVGEDPAFVQVIKMIPMLGKAALPVLITGETGTGKELCARAIHHLSSRRNFPFIAVDCGAIPDHLFENELFGHVRGAYTDAHADQKGLIALAHRGTLFLDEVDALSLQLQTKLLRFLQECTYRPLGSDRFVRADIHVIAATNRDIEECVREKQMRSDLYFRLNALRLKLPPLRERRADIELLARHFLKLQPDAARSKPKKLLPAALRKLVLYDWPGNVRELSNVVQCAALLADGPNILPEHVSLPLSELTDEIASEDFRHGRARAIEAFEKRYVEDLLRKHNGNVTRAAFEAGKDRRAFGRLKKKYGLHS